MFHSINFNYRETLNLNYFEEFVNGVRKIKIWTDTQK